MAALLEVKNLVTRFRSGKKFITAADAVSFSLEERETLAIVGESGSGKSVTALSLMRLIPNPPGRISGGEAFFEGQDLLKKTKAEMRAIRGNRISMIFQEPMTSLNPVFTVGYQIYEALHLHQGMGKKDAREYSVEVLRQIGVPSPEERIDSYPHQLSGGMRQRVMIAMALCCNPKLLIADEPTTALDVTIQAQILDLIRNLMTSRDMSMILITHDLGIVADMALKVLVMYCGQVMEYGTVRDIFRNPLHPYTRGLMDSIPSMDADPSKPLYAIPGTVPDLSKLPEGCVFAPRCDRRMGQCAQARPEIKTLKNGRQIRCLLYKEDDNA
jgi:oligopeptide/dipeptide ABC transporter ATP-binding protein